MKHANYHLISGIVFLTAAIVHGLRLLMGWDAMIGGWAVPVWLSAMVVVLAGYLAYTGLTVGVKRK